MDQFLQVNLGQILQVVALLLGIGMMYQSLKDGLKSHDERLGKVEQKVSSIEGVMISLARQEERMTAMDQRMLAQGTRIDSQATIINGRLEAINNIVSGHTAQLERMNHGRA